VLLRRAAQLFGAREPLARARCVIAEAEIALVSRDLGWPDKALDDARAVLTARGDQANAAHAAYLKARRLLLIGRLNAAEDVLDRLDPAKLPVSSQASAELVRAGIAMRRVQARAARAALARATRAAERTGVAALAAEVDAVSAVLNAPAAHLLTEGRREALLLEQVEDLLASDTLVVDACRSVVRRAGKAVLLDRRPVLFSLVRTLAQAWPEDVPRATLLAQAFGARHVDESHRARLRVEIGRLRAAVSGIAGVVATAGGFALAPHARDKVAVLTWPVEGPHTEVLALLADGEAWSSSALALALGVSQRTMQRALDALAGEGTVQSFGRGRARRWVRPPVPGFPTALLLPASLPAD
jgi:hypothetical protein